MSQALKKKSQKPQALKTVRFENTCIDFLIGNLGFEPLWIMLPSYFLQLQEEKGYFPFKHKKPVIIP